MLRLTKRTRRHRGRVRRAGWIAYALFATEGEALDCAYDMRMRGDKVRVVESFGDFCLNHRLLGASGSGRHGA